MKFKKNDPIFLRKIIIDHYSNPKHKGLTKNPLVYSINQNSESCVDNIDLELIIKNNKIINANFDGIGCAILISSSDIMAQELEGKTIKISLIIIKNYLSMIFGKKYDKNELNNLIAFINIKKQPNRIKCATIGIIGFQKIIINFIKKNKLIIK